MTDIEVLTGEYDDPRFVELRAHMTPHLRPGEVLLDPSGHGPDDIRGKLGYEVFPIRTADGESNRSVFLVMFALGDGVEPVTLTGQTTLTITPVAGEGIVGLFHPDEGASAQLLVAGANPNNGEGYNLEQGWSYGYLNTGNGGPFIVRDDSSEPFHDSFEVPVADPVIIHALGELGVWGADGHEA
jgi:hypothetical protein